MKLTLPSGTDCELCVDHITEEVVDRKGEPVWERKRRKNAEGVFVNVYEIKTRRVTEISLTLDNTKTFIAEAVCHPDYDVFNKEFGRKLAMQKIFHQLVVSVYGPHRAYCLDKKDRQYLWSVVLPKKVKLK